MKAIYRMETKGGYAYKLAADGSVLHDGERNMSFQGDDGHEWRVIGFSTRHHAHRIITLEEAANGANLGQGWVHDMDHGTHRLWCMPLHHRAVKVERL